MNPIPIQTNTIVKSSAHTIHYSPTYYPSPSSFNPFHWFDAKMDIDDELCRPWTEPRVGVKYRVPVYILKKGKE